ncbi:MAG: chromosome segregation protein SMC, partial [Alphaproteobacteria bacterium]|nr:chromosome segregation protein SMC [Alphaproteobacteria bacterium]
ARNIAEAAQTALVTARNSQEQPETQEAAARTPMEEAERKANQLGAEAKALADLLRPRGQALWPPPVDAVHVQPGFEKAFAAALGDDLQAPLDEAAPRHWRDLGPLPSSVTLPDGANPLNLYVQAPPALYPGQRLVSTEGDLWRWDGYAESSESESPAAIRLAQKNRLTVLEQELAAAKDVRAERFAAYSAARDAVVSARDAARAAEQESREAQKALIAAQGAATAAARAAAERASRLANLEAEVRRLTEARDGAEESARQAAESRAALGDGVALNEALTAARNETADARASNAEARASLENLKQQAAARASRLAAIAEDSGRWQKRIEYAAQQIAELDRRLTEMAGELETLDAIPASVAEKRNALLDAITAAEAARAEAADARAHAENTLAEADRLARTAEAALSTAREERARDEALAESATARIEELKTRIRDELDAAPEELPERAELKEGEDLPALDVADKRVEKLKQEREQLGGVNLRAEEE